MAKADDIRAELERRRAEQQRAADARSGILGAP